ncbi:hypothetical protein [Flavonifractor sp. An82]|uniref:RNA polymerase sigma factor n=1 Tax=Flavonifractor sp. An82 TaxID=1965660 RepID=UPI00194EFDD3|nr:hypothetical protein [Flavonifractor sp. An82]
MEEQRARELVDRYADAIIRLGYTWLGDLDDAKDICQEVLLKLLTDGRTLSGWTMTLTDCMADDYTIYLGVTLTAPEGTVLDWADGYHFEEWGSPTFPDLDMGGSGGYEQLEDHDPTDNQLSFIFTAYYISEGQSFNGSTMEITLGKLYHNTVWNETEKEWERSYDCGATWTFRTTLNYPDHTIRLEPDLPVHTLDVDATMTEVVVSPLSVYVCIEGEALKGHHSWVPKDEAGNPACIDGQEITLYTKDGTAIPMMDDQACSGCSGGTDPSEDGWIHLVRRPDTPLDVENLASISVCGVEIPLT